MQMGTPVGRVWLRLMLPLLLVSLLALPAYAQRNEGGVLLLHTDDSVHYTKGDGDFDVRSGLACPNFDDGTDCEERIAALDPTSGRGVEPAVWWAFLAFPEEADPFVRAVALGHRWTGDLTILDYGLGPDMMDVPDPTWPFDSGTGTGVAWRDPQVSRLTEIYWMAGYVEEGEAVLELTAHPTQGGAVADDLRHIEPLVGYGRLGLGGAVGFNPSPIANQELWSVDEFVHFGEVSRLVAKSIEVELTNLSAGPSSVRQIQSFDPRVAASCSHEETASGGKVLADVQVLSDELGFVDAILEVTTSGGFRRFVRVQAEVIREPRLELLEAELVLHPRGGGSRLGGSGQLVLTNRTPDPRVRLEWSTDLALLPAPNGGSSSGLWMGTWRNEGSIAGGETYTVDVVTNDVELDPGRTHSITIETNDPHRPFVEVPVRIGEEDLSVVNEGSPPGVDPRLPVEAGVRIVSPNPARGEVMFGLDVPASESARFDVHDARGRRIWSFGLTLRPGSHTVPWSGVSEEGPAAAGVYWGVLRTQGSATTERVVLLR